MRVLGAFFALLLGVSPAAAAEFPKDAGVLTARGLTEKDFPRWKQLVPDVYAYEGTHSPDPDGSVMSTVSMIVVTPDGVLLADGQGDAEEGRALVAAIKKLTPQPLKYVVTASDHGDHVDGNGELKAAFPNAVFISSPASQKVLAKNAVVPSETVSDKRVITMGGAEIQILNLGRAHTGGDLAVYLPQTKVLFMSEIYVRNVFPSLRSAYPSEWVAAIRKAQGMDVSWYIPGHGFIDSQAQMRADLEDARKILEHIITEGKRLHAAGVPCVMAGTPPTCEAAGKVNWGPFKDWPQLRPKAAPAMAKVYQEIDGKLP